MENKNDNTSKVSAQTVVDDIMNYKTQVTTSNKASNGDIEIGFKESKLVAELV